MPTNFYGLVGFDRVKNYPLWLKSVSIPDHHPLYPRCIPDAPTLKSRSPRPIPVLPTDQSPLCTTNPRPIPVTATLTKLNIGPTPICMLDFRIHSRPQMNNLSKCTANRQSYDGSVPEMRIWPILLIKSDLKLCIHLSRSTFLYLQ